MQIQGVTCDCYFSCHLRHCLCFSTKFSSNDKTVPDIFNISIQKIPVFTYITCKSEMVFIRSRRMKQVRFRIFKFASCKLLLFVVIVLYSRNKSFPRNPYSRVSKNSSSVSKLETRNSILETRASKLDSRFAKTSRIENRVLSRDCQLTFAQYCMHFCCNLLLQTLECYRTCSHARLTCLLFETNHYTSSVLHGL